MIRKNIFYTIFFLINYCAIFFIHADHLAVFSIPKSGTHLLLLLIQRLSGIKKYIVPSDYCMLDDTIMNIFLKTPVILQAHAEYSDVNIKIMNENNIKIFFIYRDPRDQIISAAFWIKKRAPVVLAQFDLNVLIDGLIENITSFYDLYLPWQFESNVYTTTFEKLVGEQGGGNLEDQLQEIIAIAHHMGMHIDRQKAVDIAHEIFGGTVTFREGKTGPWKKYFLERHKIAFKKVPGANELLIRLGYEVDENW